MISPVKIWRNQPKVTQMLGKTGQIITWTMIRIPPGDFGSLAPYPVVVVEFADGPKMTAQLVDYQNEQLCIGQAVVTVIRRVTDPGQDGIIPYGIKVRPI